MRPRTDHSEASNDDHLENQIGKFIVRAGG